MLAALSHPRLADCRRLFLRNYEVRINIGVHDFEKRGEQRVVINVELFVPLALSTPVAGQAARSRRLRLHALDHRARVEQGHIHLQETLCDDVAAALLAHPQVRAVARVDGKAGRLSRLRRRGRRSLSHQRGMSMNAPAEAERR